MKNLHRVESLFGRQIQTSSLTPRGKVFQLPSGAALVINPADLELLNSLPVKNLLDLRHHTTESNAPLTSASLEDIMRTIAEIREVPALRRKVAELEAEVAALRPLANYLDNAPTLGGKNGPDPSSQQSQDL